MIAKNDYSRDGINKNHQNYFIQYDTFRNDIYTIILKNVEYISAQLTWGAIFSTVAVSDDALIITSTDGNANCLQKNECPAKLFLRLDVVPERVAGLFVTDRMDQ